jgi:recombination protein RecA
MQKHDNNQPGQHPQNSKPVGAAAGAALPTGFIELDQALGLGGYPRGQICEVYGPPACGKTSLLLRAIAATQQAGGTCAFIDGDHALDTSQARRNGANPQNLYYSEPASCEQALETTLTLAQSGALDLIAIDTLSALPMQAGLQVKLNAEPGETSYQRFERYVSRAIWRLSKICQITGTTVLICNQLRHKSTSLYHEGASTTAPLALKIQAAVRLAIEPWAPEQPANGANRPETQVEGPKTPLRSRIHIIKNKFAPITGDINLIIMYNHE